MRYLVYLLIIANLAFWLWYPRPQEPGSLFPPSSWPLPPDVEPLVLLRERGVEESQPGPEEKPEADVEPAGEAPDTTETMDGQDEPVPDTVRTEPIIPLPQCHTIGPFMSRQPQLAVAKLLKKDGLDAKQRTSDVQEQIGYWVYLPAMSSVEAKQIAETLSQQGISDYFIGKQNYISLGAFSDKAAAETRRRRITDLGYEPRLEPRFRTRAAYWLDVLEDGDTRLTDERWNDIQKAYPEARRQSLSCE